MTMEERLSELRLRIDRARDEKARAEATLAQLDAQKQELVRELEALGVSEEQLDSEIERLEREEAEQLAAAEAALAAGSEVAV